MPSTSEKRWDARLLRLQKLHENKIRYRARMWLNLSSQIIARGVTKTLIQKDAAQSLVMEFAEWEEIESAGILTIKPAVLLAIAEAGQEAYKSAGVTLVFDQLNFAAVELAQTITMGLVREVTEETKEALRWILRDGLSHGKSSRNIAKAIKPRIGLTLKQVQAVANYEERLLTSTTWSRAQVDRSVAGYEKRMHTRRAKTVARTEGSRSISGGTLLGYDEAGVDAEWYTRGDEACDICAPNDGVVYTIAEAQGQIPAHPN